MTLINLLHIMDLFYHYSKNKIPFDSNGWPIFRNSDFLENWPKDMITFDNKSSHLIKEKEETVICFFMSDDQNYRRFSHLLNDISIYRQYKGVVIPDITITRDMDYEMQETVMLANQLFGAVLVANGIKIIFNTRCGTISTRKLFKNIPRNVMWASSFLGCRNSKNIIDASPYINKILELLPCKLTIYGKHDIIVDNQLDMFGINYHYYDDFHTRSKKNTILTRRTNCGRL